MAYTYNYEWYTIEVLESTGRITWEIKARNKEKAITQIKKNADKQNKIASDKNIPAWKRNGFVKEIFWDTMTLDRVGHNR